MNCEADFVAKTDGFTELAHNISMQIAATNPLSLNRESIDPTVISREIEIFTDQAKAEGKPVNIIEKMVEGRLSKFYQESCLMDQTYIKDPDKKGFGRRKIDISIKDLENSLRQQIQCFLEIADSLSTPVRHIKLHGALYNETAKQEELADLLIHVVDSLDLKVAIIGPKNSVLEDQVEKTDLLFLSEGFIDRRYREDYSLVDRGQDDALLKTIEEQIAQARGLVVNQKVTTDNNLQIDLKADTLCVHGDNPNALKLVKEVCDMLKKENIKIQSHFS